MASLARSFVLYILSENINALKLHLIPIKLWEVKAFIIYSKNLS